MIDRDVLKNIFAPEKSRTQFGKVVKRFPPAKYEIEDGAGKRFFAESLEFYPRGAMVIVQDKKITGRGQMAGPVKHYEV